MFSKRPSLTWLGFRPETDECTERQLRRGSSGGSYTVYREMEIITVEWGEESWGRLTQQPERQRRPIQRLQTAAGTPPTSVGLIRSDCDVLACPPPPAGPMKLGWGADAVDFRRQMGAELHGRWLRAECGSESRLSLR